MKTKLYQIQMLYGRSYVPIDGNEYTDDESREELRVLRIHHPRAKLRRKYLCTKETETLSIHH